MLPGNPYFAVGVRVCLSIKAMAKIVFKIAVNVTPVMLSYVENFWLCEYSKTISDLFIILLLLQTFLLMDDDVIHEGRRQSNGTHSLTRF